MLGLHNTYSGWRATNPFMEMLSPLWRCQGYTWSAIDHNSDLFYDVRLAYSKEEGDFLFAHGSVTFDTFTLYCETELVRLMDKNAKFRVLLERGDDEFTLNQFQDLLERLDLMDYPNVEIIVKKGWKVLKPAGFQIVDLSYVPFHSDYSFCENVRSLLSEGITTIKKKAKERNRLITYDMVTDPEIIYFVDHAELIEGIV